MGAELDANAIAIIGMGGRFPGARSVGEFWSNLRAGVESVSFLTDEELRAAGVAPETSQQSNYVNACAFLEDPDLFDAPFFEITPREAELLDPQQRVFLECAWSAIENAGYDVSRFNGALGVFAGAGKNHYYANNLLRNPRILETMGPVATTIASEKDFVATRISYKFDLTGPSVSVQTACSTSLVAVHLAVQSLLSLESDMAIAGGVSISNFVKQGYLFVDGGIFAPDGHLRAFDAAAAGQVGGNGSAVVVLKRLSDAVEDGDTIHAVIKGSAINNDGIQKVSFNAPAVDGQAQVVAEALEVAGVEPDTIEYIECHGTGTHLGDPIEVAALTQAFRAGTDRTGFCGLGSLKTNVGHLDAAAGVTGLIKAALALSHEEIPASLNFETPNPELALETSPFFIQGELRAWPRKATVRRAGVSSFGMGGTNAHAILEEAPARSRGDSPEGPQLLMLSARNEAALDAACDRLAKHLESAEGLSQNLADVSFTLQAGRKAFELRRSFLVADHATASKSLRARSGAALRCEADVAERGASLAFLFSGQGSQYANMARGLYGELAVFTEYLTKACDLLEPELGLDLRTLLFPAEGGEDVAGEQLKHTQFTQPALYAVEYALAQELVSRGLEPGAMLGHSIGEYVAATLAGVFSFEDALRLVAARGRLIGDLSAGGGMLSVGLSEAELGPLLPADTSISVINAPELCVVSGPDAALETLRQSLREKRVVTTALRTSHAFHSALMDPCLAEFERVVREVQLHAPERRVVSCTTGTWLTEAEATDPMYWVRHLREPVRFAAGVQTLREELDVLLEVGPGEALCNLSRMTVAATPSGPPIAIFASTRAAPSKASDVDVLTAALGQLWCVGVPFDAAALQGSGEVRRVPLPTYPFQGRRYWIEPELERKSAAGPSETREPDPARWFWVPSWQRAAPALEVLDASGKSVLVYADEGDLGNALAQRLTAAGADVKLVRSRDVDLSRVETHASLLAELTDAPHLILYLAALDPPHGKDLAALDGGVERAFFGLMALGQALASRAAQATGDAEPVRLQVITAGMQEVFDDLIHPEAATLLGVCKALNAEQPGVHCRSIDLAPSALAGPDQLSELFDEVLFAGELESDWCVALRQGLRWSRAVSAVELPRDTTTIPSPHPPGEDRAARGWLREKGVFLITGGLGGIGASLAEGLARDAGARLVLMGRTGLPDPSEWDRWIAEHPAGESTRERIESVRRIETAGRDAGAEVLIVQGDVADEADVRRVVHEARTRFGALNGVVHAAGLPGDGLLELKSREVAVRVLDPKVRGTRALCLALEQDELDFFVLCSSLATELEAVGQVDYFAANAFMNAVAKSRGEPGAPHMVAIAWEAWREVGMAARPAGQDPELGSSDLQRGREESLRLGLDPREGYDVFRRVLASGLAQVLVSTHDLGKRIAAQSEEARRVAGGGGHEEESAEGPAPATYERPDLSTEYIEPENETQRVLAAIWCDLLGMNRVGVEDDFFELGGNSLLLMQVSIRLRSELDFAVSMRDLFETPTVTLLADRIETARLLEGVAGGSAKDGAPAGDDSEMEEFRL